MNNNCEHKYYRIVEHVTGVHYAKSVCTDCGKFISWKPQGSPISETLNVKFEEKDEAKALGARWDGFNKKWYCVYPRDISKFEKWRIAKSENILIQDRDYVPLHCSIGNTEIKTRQVVSPFGIVDEGYFEGESPDAYYKDSY